MRQVCISKPVFQTNMVEWKILCLKDEMSLQHCCLAELATLLLYWQRMNWFCPKCWPLIRKCAFSLTCTPFSLPLRNRLRWPEGTCVRGEPRWPAERRGGLPQIQAHHRGCSGQELPHQLPRHGPDPWQDVLHGQEMAGNDLGAFFFFFKQRILNVLI